MQKILLFLCILALIRVGAYISKIPPGNRVLSSLSVTKDVLSKEEYFTVEEIEAYATICGLAVKKEENSLSLRLELFPIGNPTFKLGYLTAFLRPFPFGLLQLDTIQVQNRRQIKLFKRRSWTVDGPGISFIMGSYALRWAVDKGCTDTELLAVKDDDRMHMILVRLYQSFGFEVVREVGEDGASVPDRLVWGATGTLMKLNLADFFTEWTPKFQALWGEAKQKQMEKQLDEETSVEMKKE